MSTTIEEICEGSLVLKCFFYDNILLKPREASYVTEQGLTKVLEFVCQLCGTKSPVPLENIDLVRHDAM